MGKKKLQKRQQCLKIQFPTKEKQSTLPVTDCNQIQIDFPVVKGRKVSASFSGGDVSSNAGALFLQQAENNLSIIKRFARILPDYRDPSKIIHHHEPLLFQRVAGLACGYGNVSDHSELRHDIVLQTATGRTQALGSSSTLCRFDQRFTEAQTLASQELLIDTFIDQFGEDTPENLVLDFDATDAKLYGDQQLRHFNAYYKDYCYTPLYVFCGDKLLIALLQPADKTGSHRALEMLKLLNQKLKAKWPKVKLVYRGDSGFYNADLLKFCEERKIRYITGYSVNSVLKNHGQVSWMKELADKEWEASKGKQKWFAQIDDYQANKWDKPRKIIAKYERSERGENLRFIVTDLSGEPEALYSDVYCIRGDMENRIKEQKSLFADRLSCSNYQPNQFRMLLSGIAYVLLEHIRSVGLKGTEGEHWQSGTLQKRFLRLGAVVTRNTRSIKLMISRATPDYIQELYETAARQLFAFKGGT